ncbi:MAG: hypothetical protein QOF99_3504 [Pseudonocardiales bacterium]|nr:hypothetical protein [Pseudonocardiales bacterium]
MTMMSERVALHRAHDPGDSWTARGPRVPAAVVREVRQVLDAAAALLIWSPAPAPIVDYPAASAALSEVWRLVTGALRGDPHAAEQVSTSDDLFELLNRVRAVDGELRDGRTAQRERALGEVGRVLGRLSGARTVSQLNDIGVRALCDLGFDRAIVSAIRDSVWRTEAMCVRGDPEWAEEIVRVGRQNPRRLLSGLVESEAARRRSALVVSNVQSESHVHRQIAEASLARSYVTAPVLVEGRVVGLLHADCYFQRRNVDEFDRDLLATFAAGYGYALQRTMLLARMSGLRDSVGRMAGELTDAMDQDLADWPGQTGGPEGCLLDADCVEHPGPIGAPPVGSLGPADPGLSRRELDVLRLMATGQTNARIATRLVLSEGTVKTHVRNILRKLGAANRAEAVTRWLRPGATTASPRRR